MLELLDAPAEATGWSAAVKSDTWSMKRPGESGKESDSVSEYEYHPSNLIVDFGLAKSALSTALHRLIAAEPDITNYDTIVGDGDCGIGLKRGAEGK